MNMHERPDLLQNIEILDGRHFVDSSIAQFSFRAISSPDGRGKSLFLEGEVFDDVVAVHGASEIERHDTYPDASENVDIARRIVAVALFGYGQSSELERDNKQALFR